MKDLTKGSILKNLLTFAAPIIAGDMLQSMYSIIDAFWVGRLIGADALAAVSTSGPLMFFLISIVIGISIATVILTGQAYGMKDMVLLSKILVNSFMTVFVLCLVISVLGVAFAMPLLKLLNTPAEIIKDARTFITIIFSGLVFMFTYNWFAGVLRGLGDSKTPLILLAFSILLNMLMAPLLISGAFGIPKLGIAGSALATIVSQFFTTIAALVYLAKKNPILNVFKWNYRPDPAIIKKMFAIGLPVSIQLVITSLSAIIIISFVNRFGPDITAVYGIGLRIDQFSFLPAMSVGAAVSAMTAQHIGANKQEQIPQIIKSGMLVSLAFAVLFFIPVNFFPSKIASIFTNHAGVTEAAYGYFHIVSFTYFAFAVLFVLQGVIRGAGDVIPMTIFAFITLIIIRAGLAWLLSVKTGLKEHGIWIAMAASVYVGVIINFWYYKTGKWKKSRLT